jgi:putative pyruvate formate lyase activating enzyme
MQIAPAYISLFETGELARRLERLESIMISCELCPHKCGINRLEDEIARCYSGRLPIVSPYCRHFGEEPSLGGLAGVGNIFFANCTMRCVYCQNHVISQNWRIEQKHNVACESLAEMMLELQSEGARALGFVSPTHFVPHIIRALSIAVPLGFRLPLIYNTNAFDDVAVLRLLDGIIDIYLPDLKYGDDTTASRYSKVESYTIMAHLAIKEMYRQAGWRLVTDADGLIVRGLVIRHLVLPNDLALSDEVFRWIAEELDPRVTVSVMSQYYPAHKAPGTELLERPVREREYEKAVEALDRHGIKNGWIQEFDSNTYYRPDFHNRALPFVH